MVEPIVVTDRRERRVSIRLALDQVVITESRYGAGERGPDPHVHRLHADCFYVLEGMFTLSLNDGDHVVGPGTFVLVPPNVVHAFRNDSQEGTRFLNLHAPGVGFDRYVQAIAGTGEEFQAALAARFDQHPPPEDGGLDPAGALVRTAETDAVSMIGVHIGFLADADHALGAMGLVEYTAPAGFPGPPVHVHEHTWDAYYVLEGCLTMRLGDDRLELAPGDVAVVPPGTVHGFSNTLETPARFLGVHAPGGFERYFRELAAALADGPPDPAVIAGIAARYDVKNA
ncbi:MAG: cupin domain-containing protein [Actinobacteria bacterium]|nr:MAG: cupin domain-containing protein [Actinomycetota bacterium]